MSESPRNDRQDIQVHIEDRQEYREPPPAENPYIEEEAAAASAMSAQLIWINLVVVLVVAVVLLFTSGTIDFRGADDIVNDVVPTPTS